ncbi:hypothetical protein CCAX7_27570 [Capsulimonas corticalis]|uniref:Uncharacterized protein n=2 Tax=Capsulimonas corticalis TaxID=2219043 RepID=A0A402CTK8_9BACT|nr:hypothetical protein CCAX7_27570 [Capsulimonas corticalis]
MELSMTAIHPTMRRVCALGVLAALPIVLLAGCGGGGGGGGSSDPAPAVTSISPTTGTALGGTIITINGAFFGSSSSGLGVKFGTSSAASITYVSSTTIKATSPPGAGTVDITVSTSSGTSPVSAADKYVYSTDGPPPPPL